MGKQLSGKKRLIIYNKYNGRCAYCGDYLILDGIRKEGMSVDHVIPRINGGSNDIKNLLPCCKTCNGVKGTLTLSGFRRSMSYKSLHIKPLTIHQELFLLEAGFNLHSYIYNYEFYYEGVEYGA